MLCHHILFIMFDVARYDQRGDPRKPYFCEVDKYSNICGMQLGIGGAYGHKFIICFPYELVSCDGVVHNDGIQGDLIGICIGYGTMENTEII